MFKRKNKKWYIQRIYKVYLYVGEIPEKNIKAYVQKSIENFKEQINEQDTFFILPIREGNT